MRMHQNAALFDAQHVSGPANSQSMPTGDSYTSSKWNWKSNHALSARLCGNRARGQSGKRESGNNTNSDSVHDVLTIQLDALVGLVDENATRRLWKLFTHCAQSIAHGRRMENLSWRTWGREQTRIRADHMTTSLHHQPSYQHEYHYQQTGFTGVHLQRVEHEEGIPKRVTNDADTTAEPHSMHPLVGTTSRRPLIDRRGTREEGGRSLTSVQENEGRTRPWYARANSISSTTTTETSTTDMTLSSTGLGDRTVTIAKSPPLAYIIQRVIFTPPDEQESWKDDSVPVDFSPRDAQTVDDHLKEPTEETSSSQALVQSPVQTPTRHRGGSGAGDVTDWANTIVEESEESTIVQPTPVGSPHPNSISRITSVSLALSPTSPPSSTPALGESTSTADGSIESNPEQTLLPRLNDAVRFASISNHASIPEASYERLQPTTIVEDSKGGEEDTTASVTRLGQLGSQALFPTVIISQSTPKPTPPDTPARCLSPSGLVHLHPFSALNTASIERAYGDDHEEVQSAESQAPRNCTSSRVIEGSSSERDIDATARPTLTLNPTPSENAEGDHEISTLVSRTPTPLLASSTLAAGSVSDDPGPTIRTAPRLADGLSRKPVINEGLNNPLDQSARHTLNSDRNPTTPTTTATATLLQTGPEGQRGGLEGALWKQHQARVVETSRGRRGSAPMPWPEMSQPVQQTVDVSGNDLTGRTRSTDHRSSPGKSIWDCQPGEIASNGSTKSGLMQQHQPIAPVHPPPPTQKMFFLQRGSTSFSPDSNSRSDSHSRSPGSLNGRAVRERRVDSRSPDDREANSSSASSHERQPQVARLQSGSGAVGASAGPKPADTSRLSREPNGFVAADFNHDGPGLSSLDPESSKGSSRRATNDHATNLLPRPSVPLADADSAMMSVQIHRQPAPSTSSKSHTSHQFASPSTQSPPSSQSQSSRTRLSMKSRRAGHRTHLNRALERSSSRTRGTLKHRNASVGSNLGSATTRREVGTAALGGGVRAIKLIGSLEANAGSMSAQSGVGSMSTSAGSKLVMAGKPSRPHVSQDGRLVVNEVVTRSHPASATASAAPETAQPRAGAVATAGSATSGIVQQQRHQQTSQSRSPMQPQQPVQKSPLEVQEFERQVMESTVNRRRRISVVSDTEEGSSSGTEESESEDDEPAKKSAPEQAIETVEDEENDSWADEDEEAETEKREVSSRQAPPVRRDSRDLPVGSAGSGRSAANHALAAHGRTRAHGHIPHVRSKGRIAQHAQHHHQRTSSPPPNRAQARKGESGAILQPQPHHARSSSASEGPLAQAAKEAQRQRDMFTPLPRESYSSTNLQREKSLTSLSRGGRPSNLTIVLNPNPYMFPPGHPYHRQVSPMDQKLSKSMEEIHARLNAASAANENGGRSGGMKSPRHGVGLGFGGLRMTSAVDVTRPRNNMTPAPPAANRVTPPSPAPIPSAAPAPPAAPPKVVQPAQPAPPSTSTKAQSHHRNHSVAGLSKSPSPPAKLRVSKSSVAVPVVLGVTASSAPRDNGRNDLLEMSLREMGPRRGARVSRYHQQGSPAPARATVEKPTEAESKRPAHRLRGRPMDVEFSDSEDDDEEPTKATTGRSLAKEHLEAVMGGKDTKALTNGRSPSQAIVASPDAAPHSAQQEVASYRPPAPPSSPSVPTTFRAQPQQGHLPPNPRLGPARPRPHSSHGTPALPPTENQRGPPAPAPTRERRPAATSQPPVPIFTPAREGVPAPTATRMGAVVPYPWNLPYPAPIQSPRTTRLKMLESEVPDELRQDLLRERRINRITSHVNVAGFAPMRHDGRVSGYNGGAALGSGRMRSSKVLNTEVAPQGPEEEEQDDEEEDSEDERIRKEQEAQERYQRMRTRTWNGVIYQRPVW